MKIVKIKENSLAQEIGLSEGDQLIKINGERVLDHLDYEFRIADENVILDFKMLKCYLKLNSTRPGQTRCPRGNCSSSFGSGSV